MRGREGERSEINPQQHKQQKKTCNIELFNPMGKTIVSTFAYKYINVYSQDITDECLSFRLCIHIVCIYIYWYVYMLYTRRLFHFELFFFCCMPFVCLLIGVFCPISTLGRQLTSSVEYRNDDCCTSNIEMSAQVIYVVSGMG